MRLLLHADDQAHAVQVEHLGGPHYRIRVDEDEPSHVTVVSRHGSQLVLEIDSMIEHLVISGTNPTTLLWRDASFQFEIHDPKRQLTGTNHASESVGAAHVTAQMPGRVVRVLKQSGDSVQAGQGLVVIESMKMQNELRSPHSGTVGRCLVEVGESVEAGQVLFEFDEI